MGKPIRAGRYIYISGSTIYPRTHTCARTPLHTPQHIHHTHIPTTTRTHTHTHTTYIYNIDCTLCIEYNNSQSVRYLE